MTDAATTEADAAMDAVAPRTAEQYAHERAEAIQTLRHLCEQYGDLDWADDLHLADILSKHLAPYLEAIP